MNFFEKIIAHFNKKTAIILFGYYFPLCVCLLISFYFPENLTRSYLRYISLLALANHYLPLPVTAIVYYMGQFEAPIFFLAFLGAIASSSANSMEYYLLSHFRNSKSLNSIKKNKIYSYLENFFSSSPFILLISANIFPTPIDPVRWMAVLGNYTLSKFYFANFLGRFFRYAILLGLAKKFPVPSNILIYLGAALFSLSLVKFLSNFFGQKQLNASNR